MIVNAPDEIDRRLSVTAMRQPWVAVDE